MENTISLEDALQIINTVFIDMRSPGEFWEGRIPGAINVPLFDNDERSQLGKIYKTIGPDEAKDLGLNLASGKLPEIVAQIRSYHNAGYKIVVYCWRGGMRSKSIVSVLNVVGIPAKQLIGGYKNYRRYILDRLNGFENLPPIVVVCGSTGVGKTTLLSLLAEKNIPMIDLEKLANHRGSAFGHVSLGKRQTARNFDAELLSQLDTLQTAPYIVVECESKRIGNVYLPDTLYNAMQKGKKILVKASLETRVSRLIEEYVNVYQNNSEEILASLNSLKGRLSAKKLAYLHEDFSAGRVRDFVRTLLVDYYDPLYGYEQARPEQFDYSVDAEDLQEAASSIIDYLNKIGG